MSEIRKAISEHARKPQFSTFPSIPKMRTFSRARGFTPLVMTGGSHKNRKNDFWCTKNPLGFFCCFGIKNRENQKIFGMLGNARHFRHCAINGGVSYPAQFLMILINLQTGICIIENSPNRVIDDIALALAKTHPDLKEKSRREYALEAARTLIKNPLNHENPSYQQLIQQGAGFAEEIYQRNLERKHLAVLYLEEATRNGRSLRIPRLGIIITENEILSIDNTPKSMKV